MPEACNGTSGSEEKLKSFLYATFKKFVWEFSNSNEGRVSTGSTVRVWDTLHGVGTTGWSDMREHQAADSMFGKGGQGTTHKSWTGNLLVKFDWGGR
jgi:hypothetical protein